MDYTGLKTQENLKRTHQNSLLSTWMLIFTYLHCYSLVPYVLLWCMPAIFLGCVWIGTPDLTDATATEICPQFASQPGLIHTSVCPTTTCANSWSTAFCCRCEAFRLLILSFTLLDLLQQWQLTWCAGKLLWDQPLYCADRSGVTGSFLPPSSDWKLDWNGSRQSVSSRSIWNWTAAHLSTLTKVVRVVTEW